MIESQDATRRVYVLSMIAKTIEQESAQKGEGMRYEDYLKELHEAMQRDKALIRPGW